MDPLIVAIALYFLALVLAAIDIFVPSGGVLLVLSGLAAAGSILFGFRSGTTAGLIVSIVILASIPAFTYSAIKLWPHTPIGRRILLAPPKPPDFGDRDKRMDLIGLVIVAQWPLVPMGQVKVGTQRYNAKSQDSRAIDPGTRVKIVGIHDGVLVVTPTTEALSDLNASPPKGKLPASEENPRTDENYLDLPARELGLDDLEELPLDEKQ